MERQTEKRKQDTPLKNKFVQERRCINRGHFTHISQENPYFAVNQKNHLWGSCQKPYQAD